MKKGVGVVLIAAMCVSLPVTAAAQSGRSERALRVESEFERALDELAYKREKGIDNTLYGLLTVVAGAIGVGVVSGFASNPDSFLYGWENGILIGRITLWSFYGITAGGVGYAGYGFWQWKSASDDYLETLRLQTQYYNLVHPRND